MRTALRFAVIALALGLIATITVYRTMSSYPHLAGSREAGLAAGLPFFGVALLAFWTAVRQSDQPDVPLARDRMKELVWLLVGSGGWVFYILLIWGL